MTIHKIIYSTEADALYIYFVESPNVFKTKHIMPSTGDAERGEYDVYLDYDTSGELVGIEILGLWEVIRSGIRNHSRKDS